MVIGGGAVESIVKSKNVSSCTLCALHASCHHVGIWGRGSDKPSFLFVGQAPGREEDVRGQCFVGPAGQLLTQAIRKFNLRPAYVTNVVKCFPPGDRDPKSHEVERCLPYLWKEINALRPEFVVAVGGISMKALTGKTGIMTYAGRVYETQGIKVFPVIHPAYVLRYPRALPQFEGQLRRLAELGGRRMPGKMDVPGAKEMTEAEAVEWLKDRRDGSIVGFDIETTGRDPKKDTIRAVGLSDGKSSIFVNADGLKPKQLYNEIADARLVKAMHNASFEKSFFKEMGFKLENAKFDTMLLHYLCDENTDHNLESVASSVLEAVPWDINSEMANRGWDWKTVPMKVLGPYCATDAYWTVRLADVLYEKLKHEGPEDYLEQPVWTYWSVLHPLAESVGNLARVGAKIDVSWSRRVASLYRAKMEAVRGEFVEKAGADECINLNSSVAISDLFYKQLKLPVSEKTESGKPSVRSAALEHLRASHPSVGPYLEWKRLNTVVNNFLDKFSILAGEDGFVFPNFNPARVVTGRLSVTDPPIQSIPEDPFVRGMFASRFDCGVIVSFDFAQLEMRLVASESGEEALIEAFRSGEDVHSTTAKLVFGDKFTDRQRSIAKRINFGVVYGVTAHTISREYQMDVVEAEGILSKFNKSYPMIFKWMKRQHATIKTKGKIWSMFGRVRRFPEISSADEWTTERILRQAGNFPIQAAGADITNLTLIEMDRAVASIGKSVVFNQVHDSILIDAPHEEADAVEKRGLEVVEQVNRHRVLHGRLKVPLEVKCTVSIRWGGAREFDLIEEEQKYLGKEVRKNGERNGTQGPKSSGRRASQAQAKTQGALFDHQDD